MTKEIIYSLYIHKFPNGKVYVGMTSDEPEIRWGSNGTGYRKQTMMWSAIQKYGWDNIEHIVILQTKDAEEISKQEKYFITEVYHSTERDKGYNIAEGGYVSSKVYNRVPLSEESLKLISEKLKGENNPMYNKRWYTNGEINIILNKEEAIPEGFRPGMINKELKGENNPAYGKKWWTNEVENKLQKECPGEGWINGITILNENDGRFTNAYNKGKKCWNNGEKQIYSDTCPGEDWIRGGLSMSEEAIKHRRELTEKRCLEKYGYKTHMQRPEMREFYSERITGEKNPMYGKKWYTNGKKNIALKEGDPIPEGFKLGYISGHSGKKWWNNGEKCVFCFERPDETYKPGRLMKPRKRKS